MGACAILAGGNNFYGDDFLLEHQPNIRMETEGSLSALSDSSLKLCNIDRLSLSMTRVTCKVFAAGVKSNPISFCWLAAQIRHINLKSSWKRAPGLQGRSSNAGAKAGAAIRRAWGIIVTSRGVVPSNSPSASTSAGGSALIVIWPPKAAVIRGWSRCLPV